MTETPQEKLDRLSIQLWDKTKVDWELLINVSLTEPTCAVISITPDYGDYKPLDQYLGSHRDLVSCAVDALEKLLSTIDNPTTPQEE